MATARKTEVDEVVTIKVDSVELTLTTEEAGVLYFVLRHVGGRPAYTPRGHINSIIDALENAGVNPAKARTLKSDDALYFAEQSEIDDGLASWASWAS